MARPNPNSRSRDMVISMAVLLVPIVLLVWFFTLDPKAEVEAIDVTPQLSRAEAESPYPVLRATHLPEDWTPVRAAWAKDGSKWIDEKPAEGNAWLVGYMGPDGIYYGVEQRDRSVAAVTERLTRQGRETGETVQAAGLDWMSFESKDGRTRSLVAHRDEMVAVIAADTDLDALKAFAATLGTK